MDRWIADLRLTNEAYRLCFCCRLCQWWGVEASLWRDIWSLRVPLPPLHASHSCWWAGSSSWWSPGKKKMVVPNENKQLRVFKDIRSSFTILVSSIINHTHQSISHCLRSFLFGWFFPNPCPNTSTAIVNDVRFLKKNPKYTSTCICFTSRIKQTLLLSCMSLKYW